MIDAQRLGQAILIQACEDAKLKDEIGDEARRWLTCEEDGLRDSILAAATQLTLSDLIKLVEERGGSTTTRRHR